MPGSRPFSSTGSRHPSCCCQTILALSLCLAYGASILALMSSPRPDAIAQSVSLPTHGRPIQLQSNGCGYATYVKTNLRRSADPDVHARCFNRRIKDLIPGPKAHGGPYFPPRSERDLLPAARYWPLQVGCLVWRASRRYLQFPLCRD